MSEWQRFSSAVELDEALARHVAKRLEGDIAARGAASLAVSGGSTPRNMFRQLSRCDMDWSRVWITLVDERWIDPVDPDSNERLVREHLLQNRASTARFVGLKSPQSDPEQGIAAVSRRLEQVPRPFTRVILGMGADGHTASWFPQADNLGKLLDRAGAPGLGATDPVTAPVLQSRGIIIHVTGEEKRAVLEGAGASRAPVAAILEQDTTPVAIWWAP
ncbi:MAG: 6-phosphogluconolactonase [Halioglobus sp.]